MKHLKLVISVVLLLSMTSCGFYRRMYYDIDNISLSAKVNEKEFSSDYGNFIIEYKAHSRGVCFRNYSDRTLFIDLGESYFVVNGYAIRLYEESVSATTSFSSYTINNPRSIFNGVSLGDSDTYFVMSERYVSIPPHSYRVVNGKYFPMQTSISKPGRYELTGNSFEYMFSYTYDLHADKYEIARDSFSPSTLMVYRNLPKKERGVHGPNAQEEWVSEPWKSFMLSLPLLLMLPLVLIL